jgi:hypothetical protein
MHHWGWAQKNLTLKPKCKMKEQFLHGYFLAHLPSYLPTYLGK